MNICFFCASSGAIDQKYFGIAREFAKELVKNNWKLVTGGSKVGLMQELIKTVKELKGESIGVIPQFFFSRQIASEDNTKLIVTKDMAERKKVIIENSDAFVILPGGFGTMDELFEVLTLKQLGQLKKPIIIFNPDNFYDGIIKQFEKFFTDKFSRSQNKQSYFVSDKVQETIEYIANYEHSDLDSYWFDVTKKVFG